MWHNILKKEKEIEREREVQRESNGGLGAVVCQEMRKQEDEVFLGDRDRDRIYRRYIFQEIVR